MADRSRSLLHHRDFLKLWSSQTVSMFGAQVTLLALPLIAALVLDVSAFEFGLLTAVGFLPFILISLPAGVWVDRLPRRPILIVGDLGRGLVLLTIPVAFALDALTIWQLYAVAFAHGCLTVFFDVAYQSYLPSLVDRDQLVDGNGKLETSRSAAQIAGPGLAGVMIGALTAPIALVVDAVSLMLSALFVVAIRKPERASAPRPGKDGRRVPMRTEIAEGMRFVARHRYLRSIAATTAWSNLFTNLGTAILVLFLVRDRAFTPELLGFAFSIGAVGFLLGAIGASPIARRFGVGRTIIGSIALGGPSLLLVAAAPDALLFPAVAASGLLGGWATAVYNINQVSLRQAICPERLQGRMNATMRFVVWGTIPIGSVAGGALGSALGLYSTIWIAAVGSLFAFVPVLLSPLREVREMPVSPPDEAEHAGAGAAV